MGVTDITVGVGDTPILSKDDLRGAPPVLFNAGANDITLTYGTDTDSFVLEPGKSITAPAYHDVSGTVAAATEVLKILDGIEPVGGGGSAFSGLLGADLVFSHADPTIRTQNNEDLRLLPDGTGITVVGDAGSTSHGLDSNDDLFVAGELEVDGTIYTDGQLLMNIGGGAAFWLGSTGGTGSQMLHSTLYDHMGLFVGSDHGRVLVLGPRAFSTRNFDHGIQADPLIAGHSASDPDTDNTEFWSLQHDKTNAHLRVGKGALIQRAPAAAPTLGEDSTIAISLDQSGGNVVLTIRESDSSTHTVTLPYD